MTLSKSKQRITLSPPDNQALAKLSGQFDENLHFIERHLGVEINNRGYDFQIIGIPKSVNKACELLKQIYVEAQHQSSISTQQILILIHAMDFKNQKDHTTSVSPTDIKVGRLVVTPRTPNQAHYLNAIEKYTVNFGIGPSGTGKTFLAVACAVGALENETVNRIVLVRPAVEAGESLGFLPGDLSQKIDPYLRPLYDALYEMLGVDKVNQLILNRIIEIAPLAYMRGRTLTDSFIILDEAQNATKEQMKMFLTRIGFGSKALITGDITQTDLPKKTQSGLRHAITLLQDIEDVHMTFFKSNDIVRHPVVQKIIEAYENQATQ